ncbi:MAG: DUF1932 domain-containing protein [Candidatus Dormibacterales bacterium]
MSAASTPPLGTVAVISPGDMGHSIGAVLRGSGLRVLAFVGGRSERTRGLAAEAGMEAVADLAALLRASDAVLSVVPPARAAEVARRVAAALLKAPSQVLYADCNAIAPRTAREVGEIVSGAGARYVDVSIIGPPPRAGERRTRFFASGPAAQEFARLGSLGLEVRVLGAEAGLASGIKMCYAGLTKGLVALATEVLVAGRRLGLQDPLTAELAASQPQLLEIMRRELPRMPPKAYRWVGELEQMAVAYSDVGLPPETFVGGAGLYRLVEASPLGAETPERRLRGTALEDLVEALADFLQESEGPAAPVAAAGA